MENRVSRGHGQWSRTTRIERRHDGQSEFGFFLVRGAAAPPGDAGMGNHRGSDVTGLISTRSSVVFAIKARIFRETTKVRAKGPPGTATGFSRDGRTWGMELDTVTMCVTRSGVEMERSASWQPNQTPRNSNTLYRRNTKQSARVWPAEERGHNTILGYL